MDPIVATAVSQVGPTYGRKTMKGLLASRGVIAGDKQIGRSLATVQPAYLKRRLTRTESETNPHMYYAEYFGHKLHVDQNEKLVMFGVTHICAIDGFSSKIVGLVSMPVKNCCEIYSQMMRPIILKYGLWDELRVDQGKEWTLMLYVQEILARYRTNQCRPPHLQSTSKKNHMIERIWVEINKRVNYPLKKILVEMHLTSTIRIEDPKDPIHCFCVSWITLRVANVGNGMVLDSWNNHPIPGKGIPNHKALASSRTASIDESLVPSTTQAVESFHSCGGKLTLLPRFGEDPLDGQVMLFQERERIFHSKYPSFQPIFHQAANGDGTLFKEAVLFFISLTNRLRAQISV